MRARSFEQVLAVLLAVVTLVACNKAGPSAVAASQWATALGQLKSSIVAATGYSPEAVELTASPVHLRIFISDAKLSQADQVARENAASSVVSAAEDALSAHEQFVSVQVISVAIIHPAQAAGSTGDSHTEDVLEFRKGPNARFAHHIT